MITITHTPAEGTLVSGSAKGDGVWEIARAGGFRYSRNVGIYFPNSRDKAPRVGAISRVVKALEAAGHEVTVDIDAAPRAAEEAEADRLARLEDRAERLNDKAERHERIAAGHEATYRGILDMIPAGQPILVGHHSERRHRRDLAKVDRAIGASIEHDRIAEDAARRAQVAASNAQGRVNVGALQRRIKKHGADLRRIERALTPCELSGRRFKPEAVGRTVTCPRCYRFEFTVGEDRVCPDHGHATGNYRNNLETQKAFTEEELRFDREKLAAAQDNGQKVWGPGDFPKDAVKAGRVFARCWVNQAAEVVRVNAKSVTVKTQYSWTETIPYDAIGGITVKDAAE